MSSAMLNAGDRMWNKKFPSFKIIVNYIKLPCGIVTGVESTYSSWSCKQMRHRLKKTNITPVWLNPICSSFYQRYPAFTSMVPRKLWSNHLVSVQCKQYIDFVYHLTGCLAQSLTYKNKEITSTNAKTVCSIGNKKIEGPNWYFDF